MEFFEGKTILITGATGFLAKVLVEKILRTQPDIKRIFLLIRAKDSESARQRFNNEVLETELFRVVKDKVGGSLSLSALAEEKVFPVPGDISSRKLGIVNSDLKDQILREVDIIINSAATTKFDERYDVAMRINTLGALNVLKFAKKCWKVKMLVHVSTAYVCGYGTGIVAEKPFNLGETLNGNSNYLDIEAEKKVIEEKLKELEAQKPTEEEVSLAMKDLGTQRAKLHGWPNTYSFTKAMGEMLLMASKENLGLIILRPTIITSTYKEPFSGWTEGARTMDIYVLVYGRGKSNFFLGDPNTILDAIPGDMVVNSILAAVVHHYATHQSPREFIYHVGSSCTNPLKISDIQQMLFRYFTDKPWTVNAGEVVKARELVFFTTMNGLRRHISLLQVSKLLNLVLFNYYEEKSTTVEENIKLVMRLAELYEPYVFFNGTFDDTNTERLRMATTKNNLSEMLFFNPNCINWEDYFMNTHIPGVVNVEIKSLLLRSKL